MISAVRMCVEAPVKGRVGRHRDELRGRRFSWRNQTLRSRSETVTSRWLSWSGLVTVRLELPQAGFPLRASTVDELVECASDSGRSAARQLTPEPHLRMRHTASEEPETGYQH